MLCKQRPGIGLYPYALSEYVDERDLRRERAARHARVFRKRCFAFLLAVFHHGLVYAGSRVCHGARRAYSGRHWPPPASRSRAVRPGIRRCSILRCRTPDLSAAFDDALSRPERGARLAGEELSLGLAVADRVGHPLAVDRCRRGGARALFDRLGCDALHADRARRGRRGVSAVATPNTPAAISATVVARCTIRSSLVLPRLRSPDKASASGPSARLARAPAPRRSSTRQPAGERVLLARVVAAEQRSTARRALAPWPKRGAGALRGSAAAARRRARAAQAQRRVPGEGAQAQHHPHVSQQPQLAHAPGQARVALGRRRPVRRWRAAHRGGDPRPAQAQAVVAARTRPWLAKPVRHSAANRKSPERSPVNMRPVRLAPCAAGASPSTSSRAAGRRSGTGRQYSLRATGGGARGRPPRARPPGATRRQPPLATLIIKLPIIALMLWIPFRNDETCARRHAGDRETAARRRCRGALDPHRSPLPAPPGPMAPPSLARADPHLAAEPPCAGTLR